MFARRRPLLRAAVIGGGAYAVGKKRAEHSAEQSSQEADQDARGQDAEPPVSDQLKQLDDLHQQGALTDAEFATAKSRLLGS